MGWLGMMRLIGLTLKDLKSGVETVIIVGRMLAETLVDQTIPVDRGNRIGKKALDLKLKVVTTSCIKRRSQVGQVENGEVEHR